MIYSKVVYRVDSDKGRMVTLTTKPSFLRALLRLEPQEKTFRWTGMSWRNTRTFEHPDAEQAQMIEQITGFAAVRCDSKELTC